MNREIVFRCWIPEKKVMLYPRRPTDSMPGARTKDGLRVENDFGSYILDYLNFNGNCPTVGCEYRLLQYIGVKDINGECIFEGDIVEFKCYNYAIEKVIPWIGRVEYVGCEFKILSNSGDKINWMHSISSVVDICVLDNVFENPQLIKNE